MAGIFSQTFGFSGGGGLAGITSISQIPYIAIGGFGLFLYLLYAGRTNAQVGEKKEGVIGMFIIFAFVMDIFYLKDVWLVTILGSIAGFYAMLAFAGVFGAVAKLGGLGVSVAKEVKKKTEEMKAKKETQKASSIAKFEREVNDQREESLLLLNPDFITTKNQIQSKNSYFFNTTQNMQAYRHILLYLRQIINILKDKTKLSLQISNLEAREKKAISKEEKAEKGEAAGEQGQIAQEEKEAREMMAEAALLPIQMRSQVQMAVTELKQAESRAAGEKGVKAQEIAEEQAQAQLAEIQIKIAKNLNSLQNRMLKIAISVEKNLAKIESAAERGGPAEINAVKTYPPARFVSEFNGLYQQHEGIKAIMIKAIGEEKVATKAKIMEEMLKRQEVAGEVIEDTLIARSQQIKAQIDKVLGGVKKGDKKRKQDIATLNESFKSIGLTKTEGLINNQYLQRLQAHLNYLNQMEAALAASR